MNTITVADRGGTKDKEMTKQNQTIKWEMGNDQYGIFRNQEVSNVIVDDESYTYGEWNGKLVASFHIENGTWFVM